MALFIANEQQFDAAHNHGGAGLLKCFRARNAHGVYTPKVCHGVEGWRIGCQLQRATGVADRNGVSGASADVFECLVVLSDHVETLFDAQS